MKNEQLDQAAGEIKMTPEQLARARVDEAWEQAKKYVEAAARLAREGGTPPVAVDPDLAEAECLANEYGNGSCHPFLDNWFLKAVKRGRELERQEAKPGMVWVKHDGSGVSPVAAGAEVLILRLGLVMFMREVKGPNSIWLNVTHYAIITEPEDVA